MTYKGWKTFVTGLVCIACAVTGTYAFAQTEPQTVQPLVPITAAPATESQPAPTNSQKPAQLPAQLKDIPIGAGDLLEIRVFGVQDLSQDVRVSSTGDVNIPLTGPIHVADLTQTQAEDLIEEKLRDGGFLKDPQVTIFTKEYATQGVSVLGEVGRPGVYPLLGSRRLFDVISMAGGLSNRAGKNVVITHRDTPDQPTKIELSNDPDKASATNVPISPGDTVSVSRAGVVYVVGDVGRPAGFVMDNNDKLTVLQAIALAGGPNGTASLNNSKIIRKTPTGVQEIPMPLKKILSAKASDIPLQPDDVVFVPQSATKGVARRGAESILQITTGLAIYRR
jgi:polysaccharide biosynthesis/export protein